MSIWLRTFTQFRCVCNVPMRHTDRAENDVNGLPVLCGLPAAPNQQFDSIWKTCTRMRASIKRKNTMSQAGVRRRHYAENSAHEKFLVPRNPIHASSHFADKMNFLHRLCVVLFADVRPLARNEFHRRTARRGRGPYKKAIATNDNSFRSKIKWMKFVVAFFGVGF